MDIEVRVKETTSREGKVKHVTCRSIIDPKFGLYDQI